jgi:RluA family pseudouridine synthase
VTIARREAPEGGPAAPPILLESEGWLVIDKPAGLATTPNASRPGQDVATVTGLAPAHRLDRFTSGCLLLTWTPEAARHFERAFRERLVRKEYVAVVRGVPSEPAFVVDAPLGPDALSRVPSKMRVAPDGEPATTRVTLLASDGGTSLVRAEPLTGRRHQIRVHLAHAGHPIVGDLLYGDDEREFVRFQLGQSAASGRHLLHARTLDVPDLDGTRVVAEAPWPEDVASRIPAPIARASGGRI